MYTKRYFIARVYADYEAALQTIEMLHEYSSLQKAEAVRRGMRKSAGLADNALLIVTAGKTWEDAERELKARLGE